VREAGLARADAQPVHLVGVHRTPFGDPLLGGIELLLDEAPGPRLPLRGLGVERWNNRHGAQLVLTSTAAASPSSGAASGASATAVSATLLGGSTRSASAGRWTCTGVPCDHSC
jgi:hypothetical protein